MKKMEHDIIASSSQLAIADWNNHDSMTAIPQQETLQRTIRTAE